MSDVFLLGSGFSKAVSRQMPVTKELSRLILARYKSVKDLPSEIRDMIEEDVEKALTFLATSKPWLAETENLRHRVWYLEIAHVIRYLFLENSRDPSVWGTNRPPKWFDSLIAYWHSNRSTVITLNYDTLIERVASTTYEAKRRPIPTGHLYPIRLTPATVQGGIQFLHSNENDRPQDTFKLFKLHGSTNWFYSGRSDFFGEELFYVPCNGGVDGVFDIAEGRDADNVDWCRLGGKSALIIPPTLDKTVFFQHEALRSMWFQAGQAIRSADRLICLGYSLPKSDLTMAQFLKSCAPAKQTCFEIVNLEQRDQHFAETIGGDIYEFRQELVGDEQCVPKFVIKGLMNDRDEQVRAARELR
jgi:hypothetical protein